MLTKATMRSCTVQGFGPPHAVATPVAFRPALSPCRSCSVNSIVSGTKNAACLSCVDNGGINNNINNNINNCNGGNNNNNNHNSGGHGNHGDHGPRQPMANVSYAMLGALALTLGFAALPASSSAAPGSLSTSPTSTGNFLARAFGVGSTGAGASYKASSPALSSSAPSRGGFTLSDTLDMTSLDLGRGSRTTTCGAGSSPPRPRSKALHVATKGGTLVVPLPANSDAKSAGLPPRAGPWQRFRVVEAPIALSEQEARMVAGRQNRVRDSLLVH